METPGNLLFDSLASGATVVLPSVGTLRVERSDAAFLTPSKISAPANRVVFVRKEFQTAQTMPELMARTNHLDITAAETAYYQWIREARQEDGSLLFEPAGRLAEGGFTPSESLKAALNPGTVPDEVTVGKSRGKALGYLLIAATAALTVGAVWYMWESDDILERRAEKLLYDRPAAAGGAERAETERVKATDAVADNIAENIPAPEPNGKEDTATAEETSNRPASGGRYILVAGVYSTEANADRFIAEDKLGVGTPSYAKRPYGSKVMVGIMATDDRDEAARYKRSFGPDGYELWIYDTAKKR